MDLVVAEKPSVARDIARVLGASKRGDGFLEGPEFVITWCIGHLIELDEPAAYDPSWKQWRLDLLPMLPERFKLRPSKSTASQWRAVKSLLRDKRFDRVVNACDAGREGELIFRWAYDLAGSRLPIERLWVSSLTDAAVRAGFAKLQPGRRYEPLADAARCRAEADWLVGLNATRAVTVRGRANGGGELWSVGRVQTPTLALVVARDKSIRAFTPRDYWEVVATLRAPNAQPFTARWTYDDTTRVATKPLADALVSRCARGPAPVVESVEGKRQRVPPPLLFDLTSLQRTANARWGWPAARTLSLAQSLYEKHKALTYPRTDSRHLSTDLRTEIPGVLRALSTVNALSGFAERARSAPPLSRRYVDDAKVSDHHAIIPTSKAPSGLDGDEARLYDMVARRFLGAFFPDAEFDQTTVTVRVGDGPKPAKKRAAAGEKGDDDDRFVDALPPPPDRFVARGRVRVVAGWQEVAGIDGDDPPQRAMKEGEDEAPQGPLPALTEGQRLDGRYDTEAKQTKPPRRYTEATLLAAMESAGKEIEDEALRAAMRDSGLGTPATRASIIETLLDRGYVARDKKAVTATPKGEALIDGLAVPALRSPELTGSWEARLARMARGEDSRARFMADIHAFVRESIDAIRGGAPVRAVGDASAPATTNELRAPRAPRTPRATSRPARAPAPRRPPARRPPRQRHLGRVPALPQGRDDRGPSSVGLLALARGCGVVVPFNAFGRTLTEGQMKALCARGRTPPTTLTVDGRAARGRWCCTSTRRLRGSRSTWRPRARRSARDDPRRARGREPRVRARCTTAS
ncbi:MAG: DNA topoisomerase [Polyangiales bacterium]